MPKKRTMWQKQHKAIGFTKDLRDVRFLTIFVDLDAGIVVEVQQENDGEIVVLEVDTI